VDHTLIYNETYKSLYRFLYYKNLDKKDVEDLLQESYYRFFSKYGDRSLLVEECKKILYSVALNVYREWVRRNMREQTFELEQDYPSQAADIGYFEDAEVDDFEKYRSLLFAAIDELNPTLQAVVRMRFIENMTRAQIAEKLGTKEKYVHIYQQRAIEMLQKKVVSPMSLS
jgi:RNA polymerase sigma factor (sigma-70 family)